MKFTIKKTTWSYDSNINGDKINEKHLYVIQVKNGFFGFLKKKKYLRINSTYNNKYLVTITYDYNHANKYRTEEEAVERVQDILNNPDNYEL